MLNRAILVGLLAGCAVVLGVAHDTRGQAVDKVQLQLKWVTQAQFAGYYAAKAKGFYAAESLDVSIRQGGPDIVAEQVVAGGGAEFGIDWLPSLLAARDQGVALASAPRSGAGSAAGWRRSTS